jgi:putative FmdB family regulatory protein
MPIYEYQCQACDQVTDFLQKMSDEPLRTCPECNEDALKKLVSAPRFRLAGSGWYETDFKADNKRNLVSSENKTEAKSDSDSKEKPAESKSADSKPDSKSSDANSSDTKTSAPESKPQKSDSKPTNSGDGKAA